MRILHTSDWHLGRSFHREGMLGHQAVFIDHLVEAVTEERIELVIVAGDVYDRALPPADAVQLADEAFTRLAATGARLVVTSGNHDSALRLGFGARLLDRAGVHVRTNPQASAEPIELADKHGAVEVFAIPYLDPEAMREPWSLAVRSHQVAMSEAITRVRARRSRKGARRVIVAHAFVAGGEPSDSERDIAVGGVSRVAASTFDGFSYTALGHLHRAQVLTPSIRYSGSPLAYSFSEADQRKGSWIVDLDHQGLASAEFLCAPVPRPLGRLRGRLEELLADPRYVSEEVSWLHIALTDPVRPMRAMERLQRRFPHTLLLSFEPAGVKAPHQPTAQPLSMSDHDIACAFIAELRGSAPTEAERSLLQEAIDARVADPDADPLAEDPSHPLPDREGRDAPALP